MKSLAVITLCSLLALATALPTPNAQTTKSYATATIQFYQGEEALKKPVTVIIGATWDVEIEGADRAEVLGISTGKDASGQAAGPENVTCTLRKNYSSDVAGEMTAEEPLEFDETVRVITRIDCAIRK